MTRYYDLCDGDTFSNIRDVLIEEYGINEDVLSFAFGIYGANEETLENICYYYGIDIDELLDHAGIEDDDDEETDDGILYSSDGSLEQGIDALNKYINKNI